MYHVPHAESSAYPVHRSTSEVNRSGADAQVVPVTVILLSSIPLSSSELAVFYINFSVCMHNLHNLKIGLYTLAQSQDRSPCIF